MECDNLKRLFAGLVVYNYNLKLLHWNCIGKHFDTVHELMDDYSSVTNNYIDEIAEIMKMFNVRPLCLECALKLIKEDNSHEFLYLACEENFDSKDVWKNVSIMFSSLINLYENTINCTEEHNTALPGDVISKLQEHQYWFRKEYFYKIKARLDD